jgi:hypothetical protein
MAIVTRWLASTALAAGLGMATLAVPAPAQAQDDLTRVIVDVADVIFRGGDPYYRYGDYGYDDRLLVERDRYGRPVYYRYAPNNYRSGPPYGNAYGYWKKHDQARQQSRVKCDSKGRCVTRYYDPRYDRRSYDNRYYSYDRRHDRYDRDGRYWDGRRWRDYDDD